MLKPQLPEAGDGELFSLFLPSQPWRMQSESTRHFKNLKAVFKPAMFLISHTVSDRHTELQPGLA